MKKISTDTEAKSLSELTEAWKVVARRYLGTVGSSAEIHALWRYCGAIQESNEVVTLRRMAFPARGDMPGISLVTGRDDRGTLTLYGRIFPKPKYTPVRKPLSYQ